MRIDGFSAAQSLSLANGSDILSRLSVGDVVRAQILEFTASEVLLKLMDGMTVKAATMSPVDAQQGEFVDFFVKGKFDNQLLLETVKNVEKKPVVPDAELKQQLASLGLKLSDTNLDIAKHMKLNELPFTRDVFNKINDMIMKFKDLTPAKAAFLEAGGIKPEGTAVSTLESFVNGKAQIATNLNELLSMVKKIHDEEALKLIAQRILNVEKNIENPVIQFKPENNSETVMRMNRLLPEKLSENPVLRNALQTLNSEGKLLEFFKENNFELPGSSKKLNMFLESTIEGFKKLPLMEKNAAIEWVRDLASRLKTGKEIGNDAQTGKLQQEDNLSAQKSKEIIHKAFDKFFSKIESDTLDKDINVKNMYKELYSKLEGLKESVALSNLAAGNEIQNKIDTMQNNIRFLNELNNYSTYVQIPLTIQGQTTTGDLFILKRGAKKKKLDPENVSMLISLNTMNIGQVDSLISVSRKNISVNMRVEDSSLFEMIRESHKDLYNALSEKGYKLVDLKYKVMEEKANVVTVKEIAAKELQMSKQSIDFRI